MVNGQNELVLHDVEIDQNSKIGTNSMADIDPSVEYDDGHDCAERLRALFDEVRLRFQNKIPENKNNEHLGGGQPLDLLKIFWAVWNRGGCDLVSENRLWGSVAEECKIDCSIAEEYVKPVYMKYISELDRSFRTSINTKWWENGNYEDGRIGLLMSELQEEFSGVLQCAKKKNGVVVVFEQESCQIYNDVDNLEVNEVCDIVEKATNDDEYEILDSKKRKRDFNSLSSMVNWVLEVAKHPDDVTIGRIPECSKWKHHRKEDLWAQALLAREALRRLSSISTKEDSKKRLKMGPSMYEDRNSLTPLSTDKIRISERLNFVTKLSFCPCCNSSSTAHGNVVSPFKPSQGDPDIEILETPESDCSPKEEKPPKRTSVGPYFQAQVPEWTGMVIESDPKWLGTQMWHFSDLENNFIGNGRKQSCGCRFPGSVACVRFHIAENRMRLRREIGSLFYKWNFHCMGEEVSLSWTIEEEKRFKLMERLNLSSPGTCFWDDIAKFFPDKSKEKLVSYYFNVFLIGRRAYQNRVTPKDVDSDDDDESEFKCVGGRFGIEALVFGCSDRQGPG